MKEVLQYLQKLDARMKNIERGLLLNKEILSINEAAALMDVSVAVLYNMNAEKPAPRIPFTKPNGKQVYYKRKDIMNYLNRNRRNSKEEIQQLADKY